MAGESEDCLIPDKPPLESRAMNVETDAHQCPGVEKPQSINWGERALFLGSALAASAVVAFIAQAAFHLILWNSFIIYFLLLLELRELLVGISELILGDRYFKADYWHRLVDLGLTLVIGLPLLALLERFSSVSKNVSFTECMVALLAFMVLKYAFADAATKCFLKSRRKA